MMQICPQDGSAWTAGGLRRHTWTIAEIQAPALDLSQSFPLRENNHITLISENLILKINLFWKPRCSFH